MSGIRNELQSEEVEGKDVFLLSRTMGDFEREVIIQQTVFKKELDERDHIIVGHEKEKDNLNTKLDDLVNRLEILKKLVEQQGHEVTELPNMRKELADGFVNLGKLVEQQAQQLSCSTYVGNRDVSCNVVIGTPLETRRNKMDETAVVDGTAIDTTTSSTAFDGEALMTFLKQANETTISRYEQMLTDRDQIVESIRSELKVFTDTIVKKDEQLNEQLATQKSDISKLNALAGSQDWELLVLKKSVQTKEEEISGLKDLLKMADRKLEERLDQMKQLETIASSVQQLTRLYADGKVSKTGKMEAVHTAVESIQSKISSLTELMDHIKHVGTWKSNDASIERKTDLPDYLTRLQQLYPRMTLKLSAASVAAELFQNDVLSLAELQKVQCSQTPVEAAEYLLNRLLQIRNRVEYDYFLNALKATEQQHLFLWLTFDEYDIDSQHSDLIRQNYTFLVQNLSPTESGLMAELFQRGVVDDRDKLLVEVGEGIFCQAERLLSVLSRKSVEKFQQFLVALDQTRQSHIANALRSYQQPVESSGEDHVEIANTASPYSDLTLTTSTSEGHDVAAPYTKSPLISTVTHVIAANEGRKGTVTEVRLHGDELFLARWNPKHGLIEVYNATNFTFKRYIEAKKLEEDLQIVNGLTSCDSNKCLYVGCGRRVGWYIARVELTGNNTVVQWKVEDDYVPQGLSVNSEHNLMVACWGFTPKLIEYTTRGEELRQIYLRDDVMNPSHAIKLNSDEFLVCHGLGNDLLQRVCVVNANGRVIRSYGNKPGSEKGQFSEPRRFAVDRNGYIFVVDRNNDRIVVLDSALEWSRDIHIDSGFKTPDSLYIDEERNLLFVGEWHGDDSRVVVVTV